MWGSGAGAIGQKVFEGNDLFLTHSCTALLNLTLLLLMLKKNECITFKMAAYLQVLTGNIYGKV